MERHTLTKECKHCGDPGYTYMDNRRGKSIKRQANICAPCNNYKSKYNMNRLEVQEIFASQNNQCALCSRTHLQDGRPLYIDHCHETGKIRGALCILCNTAIGTLGDNLEGLEKAVNYLSTTV